MTALDLIRNSLSTLQLFAWMSLLLALGLAFWPRLKWVSGLLALVSLACGIESRDLGLLVLLWMVALVACARGARQTIAYTWPRFVTVLCLFVVSLLFFSHQLPGFGSFTLIPDLLSDPGATPYNFSFRWDKPLAGLALALMALHPAQSLGEPLRLRFRPLVEWILGGVVILSLACLSGFIKWEPKFPYAAGLWMVHNLFFVALPEEALFRGLVQNAFGNSFHFKRFKREAFWILGAVLFGAAHFAGGGTYVLLSMLAGLLYGWIYLRTGSLRGAVFAHWGLNVLHFVFFSYPVGR